MRRVLARSLTGVGAIAFVVGLLAASASAHVTVNPNTAPKGGFEKLTFRVPTEKDSASTTKVEVAFPAAHPIASVSVKPHAGWTANVLTTHLATPIKSDDGEVTDAVSQITWTADTPDASIKPGQFDEFDISGGPLPADTDKLVFKVLQTYSDGTVVRWIDEAARGAAEPQHPAPALTLTVAAATPTPAATTGSKSSSDSGKGLAVAALAAAIVALVVALVTARRATRRTPSH